MCRWSVHFICCFPGARFVVILVARLFIGPREQDFISDIVKEREFALAGPSCGCIEGAMLRGRYFQAIEQAGFADLEVIEERPWHRVAGETLACAVTLRAWKRAAKP